MMCKYCPSDVAKEIVHCNLCCLKHIGKTNGEDSCKYVPAEVQFKASHLLMRKGRIKEIQVSDGGSEVEIVDSGSAEKKKNNNSGEVVAVKHPIEAFLDRSMSVEEMDKSNLCMLRCIVLLFHIQCNNKHMFIGSLFMEIYLFLHLKTLSSGDGCNAYGHLIPLHPDIS